MRIFFTLVVGFFISAQSFGQLGFIAGYKTFNAPKWDESFEPVLNESPYPNAGWQIGVDYWFRLKKRRIEFTPEISFANFKHSFSEGELKLMQFGLHFNTAFYVFDLASDCNCPTFSKDGNVLGKGFFIEVSPGISYLKNEIIGNAIFEAYNPEHTITLGGSVGGGLDIGLSDIFTLTPIARFYYYPSTVNMTAFEPGNWEDTDVKQFFAGLRVRLHFKEIAKARYR